MEQEDLVPDDAGAVPVAAEDAMTKDALAGVDRSLQLSDLKEIGVQKMVLDRLDKTEAQNRRLEKMRIEYYETREQLAVAESSLKRLNSLDVMQDAGLSVGSLLIGFLPSAWGNWGLTALVFLGGIVLIGAVVVSKKRNA
jgi:hypothetical protein